MASDNLTNLECTRCGAEYESERLWRLSPCCSKPLYARYDLDRIARTFRPDDLRGREPSLWRYALAKDSRQGRLPRTSCPCATRRSG